MKKLESLESVANVNVKKELDFYTKKRQQKKGSRQSCGISNEEWLYKLMLNINIRTTNCYL